MAYATLTDAQTRLGRSLSAEENALVTARLEDIERIITARIPDLAQKITTGALDVELVKYVEVEAVLRVLRNPDGLLQETDGNYSYQVSQDAASGRLEILASEWELLGYQRGGMFQIIPNLAVP
ncbi:MAG: hypothetical protein J2P17_30795 [Mycobacterium sp.]|nr:hypothetical protein [Mycobacterium sp.]